MNPITRVRCKACGRPVEPDDDLPTEQRPPCPECGGQTRQLEGTISSVLQLRGYMKTLARERRRDGGSGWGRETIYGDDFYWVTGQWNRLRRVVDWEANWYEKRVEAPDGTVTYEVSEPLDQHQGHGAAKRKKPDGGA
jgi:predicted nucleic acid-binding Zn ribbon protein